MVGRPRGHAPRATQVVVGALLVVAVAVAGLSSCTPGPRVLVIGDSLTVGAVEAGLGEADGAHWAVLAEVGRGTNAGVEVARRVDARRYDLVVVALGTNDHGDSKVAYRARIEAMLAALGGGTDVVWINVDAETPRLASARRGVNPALAEADAAHRRLRVADWSRYVRQVDGMAFYRARDQVHYNRAGYRLRARWMERLPIGR